MARRFVMDRHTVVSSNQRRHRTSIPCRRGVNQARKQSFSRETGSQPIKLKLELQTPEFHSYIKLKLELQTPEFHSCAGKRAFRVQALA
jgi:hypothetical protein